MKELVSTPVKLEKDLTQQEWIRKLYQSMSEAAAKRGLTPGDVDWVVKAEETEETFKIYYTGTPKNGELDES